MTYNFEKIRKIFIRKINSEADGNNDNNLHNDNSPSTGSNRTSEASNTRLFNLLNIVIMIYDWHLYISYL